jgi:hypothetical protein
MTSGRLNRVDQALADLATHDSDAARSARVRARCHALLAQSTQTVQPRPDKRLPEWAVVWAFCLVYLCAVMLNALRFEGWL